MIVAGERMDRSIADFVRACEVTIEDEQSKPAPDTALMCGGGKPVERLGTGPVRLPPLVRHRRPILRRLLSVIARAFSRFSASWRSSASCENLPF